MTDNKTEETKLTTTKKVEPPADPPKQDEMILVSENGDISTVIVDEEAVDVEAKPAD